MKIPFSKAVVVISQMFLLLLTCVGCESTPIMVEVPSRASSADGSSVYIYYAPARIDILPLSEFTESGEDHAPKIKVYVSMLDPFSSQIKAPAVFRFELYQKVLRSADPKGKRIVLWPDADLTAPSKNNQHWRDFLRAYEFELPFELQNSRSYILQATCLCPNGKRLLAEIDLKHIN